MNPAATELASDETDVSLGRLNDQIQFYDRTSKNCLKWFRSLKILTIVTASLITVLSASLDPHVSSYIVAWLGGLIAMMEGIQHVYQFHESWISYRATCEVLKSEKYLYLAAAGIYAIANHRHALLAERTEAILSREHARWAMRQEQQPPEAFKNDHATSS